MCYNNVQRRRSTIVLIFCAPILFSFLFQFTTVKRLNFSYLTQRSTCDYCERQLMFYEIIPIFSFLYLKGKTHCCNRKLSLAYFCGECASLLSLLFLFKLPSLDLTLTLFIFFLLLTASIEDLKSLEISLSLIIVFLLAGIYLFEINLRSFLIVTIPLNCIYLFFHKVIGYGDILIFSFLSLFLSLNYVYHIILCTFLLAGAYSFSLVLLKFYRPHLRIPLIPFIFLAFILVTYIM
ncbi:prepilin peptidase [Staphylococcus marylandisciuri]|uniref:prepilin peptidase n=1 Tax=Staphylococcus marylandisciuri TaxID=2981529 RepID=UPI0035713CC0